MDPRSQLPLGLKDTAVGFGQGSAWAPGPPSTRKPGLLGRCLSEEPETGVSLGLGDQSLVADEKGLQRTDSQGYLGLHARISHLPGPR